MIAHFGFPTRYPGNLTLVSNLSYNEIGQLINKKLHSTDSVNYLQNIAYTYNERGWLLKSNAALFEMQLQYNSVNNITGITPAPQYNGNIASQSWGTGISPDSASFVYAYDRLNRLTSGSSADTNFVERNITYDQQGNIQTLSRVYNGNFIDSLSYNYASNANATNQLQNVTDNAFDSGTVGYKTGTHGYAYDGNGNMTADSSKRCSISYNMLNLPESIRLVNTGRSRFNAPSLFEGIYLYDAIGNKLAFGNKATGAFHITFYISGIQYDANTKFDSLKMSFIQTEEGRVFPYSTDTSNYYEYYLSDHLGNNRIAFDKPNGAGITVEQQDDYMPFGTEMGGLVNSPKNEYLYNKKELQEELGQYDYGARFYDPVIGRWNVVDPKAETSRRFSSYVYGDDNPIRMIDPDGMEATDWYKDKLGHMKFNASVKTQADVNKVSPGGKYEGAEVKTKGATYFKDGSAFFKSETKAYQFMVNNSNMGQGKSETENFAWVAKNGVAVLPTSGVDSQEKSFQNGSGSADALVYNTTGSGSSLTVDFHGDLINPIASAHTHPDDGPAAIQYQSGSDVSSIKSSGVPGFVISSQTVYGMSVQGAYRGFDNRGLPVDLGSTNSFLNGSNVIIPNINAIINYMNSHE